MKNYHYTRLGAGFEMRSPMGDGLFLNLGTGETKPLCPFDGSIRTKKHSEAITRQEFMDAYEKLLGYQRDILEEKEFDASTLEAVQKINAATAAYEFSTYAGWEGK